MFGSPFQMQPFLASGKVKILATTRSRRVDIIPGVPTFAELGYPDMIADAWTAFMAPAGTPPAVIRKLSEEFTRIVQMPEVIRVFERDGYTLVGSTPSETGQMIRRELKRWEGVVKASGWKVQ